MKAFVLSPSDLSKLQQRYFAALQSGPIVCSSLLEVEELQHADRVYFVISEFSMYSTAYQELVTAALSATEQASRWLLLLDKVTIPQGFRRLRSLPIGTP